MQIVVMWLLFTSLSSESVEFFTMVHQLLCIFFSFSEYLELFSDFCHIGLSDVILLAVSDACLRKLIFFYPIFRSFT